MKVDILQVPACPNATLLERRIAQAVAGEPIDVTITHRVVEDETGATETGMTGSPTLLVDGRDPFAEPGSTPSVSCRLYRTADGAADGAPSVGALRAALKPTPPVARIDASTGTRGFPHKGFEAEHQLQSVNLTSHK